MECRTSITRIIVSMTRWVAHWATKWAVQWVLLWLIVFPPGTLLAQTAANPVDIIGLQVLDDAAALAVGQTFIVNVQAAIDTPTYGFGFQLRYDPAVLQLFARPDTGDSVVPFVPGDVFPAGLQRVRNLDFPVEGNTWHEVDVVYTVLPPADPATGSGNLGSLAFTILDTQETHIELHSPRLITAVDGQAKDIAVTIQTDVLHFDFGVDGGTVVEAQSAPENALSTVAQSPVNQPETTPDLNPLLVISVLVMIVSVFGLLLLFFLYHRQRGR
jgi:hypothetical protein